MKWRQKGVPRLDVWLVEKGHFSSRQIAKRAIRDGLITIDGKPAKPSSNVRGTEDIKVIGDFLDHPVGYEKLKQLEVFLSASFILKDSLVLDIGSSAGGFLRYLAEKGAQAIGIEVSNSFKYELTTLVNQYSNLSVIFDDAFKIEPSIICKEECLDLLLVDVTTDTNGTLKLIRRFRPLLKNGGYLIAAFKLKPKPTILNEILIKVKDFGFINVRETVLDESLTEFHIIAART
jgi:23S rRNA (cytidine1920-2'-O)/16S rRNA (cytidine1409-2'-O)-methyltransferase